MSEGNRLFTEDLFARIKNELGKCKRELFFVSPYITKVAAEEICNAIPERIHVRRIVTLPPGIEYVTGASDPEVLYMLQKAGFQVRMLSNLHAKLFLYDNRDLLVGSANCTGPGLQLVNSNEEILTLLQITVEERRNLIKEFWEEAKDFNLSEAWVEQTKDSIRRLKEEFKLLRLKIDSLFPPEASVYEDLLAYQKVQGLIAKYNHIPQGFGRNAFKVKAGEEELRVKIFLSDIRLSTPSDCDEYYSFTIGRDSRDKLKYVIRSKAIHGVILILKDHKNYLVFPRKFIYENLLPFNLQNEGKVWQFQVKKVKDNYYMQSSGRKNVRLNLNVTQYLCKPISSCKEL